MSRFYSGAIAAEGEWNSFNGSCSEEANFMAQLLGNYSLPTDVPSNPNFAFSSSFWPDQGMVGVDESEMHSSGDTQSNMYSFSHGSSYTGGSSIFFPSSNHESYDQILLTNRNSITVDYCMMSGMNNSYCIPVHTSDVMEGDDFLNHEPSDERTDKKLPEDVLQGKNFLLGMGLATPIPEPLKDYKEPCPSKLSKKRSRITGELQKAKRSVRSRKEVKMNDNDRDSNTNSALNRHRSSSCCSEDDSNEMTGLTSSSSSKGKTRAIRGAATDPQSLYARKRRERINERLKILQNLVPNGTKVDISTMLEEAVQYVKFLQLQIKLLSSDDMWMYAPIAYNGMDIGLDLNLPTPKPQS